MSDEPILGIDLGTTNSEVAAFLDGQARVLGPSQNRMLPSCVGLTPDGELLVGEAARNQHLLYPERTIRSIKRKMGTNERVRLGDQEFSPPEISALILRELAAWARRDLGREVSKAVITVPAYFNDAQRQATREAGALAGLEVVRILNEPTAASLAYGYRESQARTVLVYDLGGGTFDVSIVNIQGDVTEVLASHGNTQLGGDDFDQLLLERLLNEFQSRHGINLNEGHHRVARSRLWWAAEEAKKKLSFEPFVHVREEALVSEGGKPLHLDLEIAREEFEEMIRPLVETTLESVSRAMTDAGKTPRELDAVLLVGGATRTPLITRILEERTGLIPRQEVHPDLCVALGAGVLASRLAGHEIERVLVDVSPYSFGISHLGLRGGYEYPYCYRPIIRRNTPLPITRTETYFTTHPRQTTVQVDVYQGEDEDALKNAPVGDFLVEGLTPTDGPNEVLVRMNLDLNGILNVTALEKRTGFSNQISISNALTPMSAEELAAARARLEGLHQRRAVRLDETLEKDESWDEESREDEEAEEDEESEEGEKPEEDEESEEGEAAEELLDLESGKPAGGGRVQSSAVETVSPLDPGWAHATREARALLERSRGKYDAMHEDDREEAINLHEQIEAALVAQDAEALEHELGRLRELLFFIEGK